MPEYITTPENPQPENTQLAHLVARLLRAALDQRSPSPRLKKLLNEILDSMGHDLSTKRQRRLYRERQRERV